MSKDEKTLSNHDANNIGESFILEDHILLFTEENLGPPGHDLQSREQMIRST